MNGDCPDRIVGTWHGTKNSPGLASGVCTITFHANKTAKASGKLHVFGRENTIAVDELSWTQVGTNRYVGAYEGHELVFSLNAQGTVILARVNPYKLGAVDNPRFNIDIPVDLRRVAE